MNCIAGKAELQEVCCELAGRRRATTIIAKVNLQNYNEKTFNIGIYIGDGGC